jgi:outer membrane protein OmpA-like peptidoglycan-associated protein
MIKLKSILLEETKNNTTRLAMFSEAEADDDPFNNRDYPPKLKGLGAVKKGEFSVSSAADPANKGIGAYFKRNTAWLRNMIKLATDTSVRAGISNRPSRNLGLIFSVEAVKRNLITPADTIPTPPNVTPNEPSVQTISIDPLDAEDPFKFDQVINNGKMVLAGNAQELIDKFISDILKVKETYGADVYAQYIQFLKDSKPTINGYASKDGDPTHPKQGYYPPCKGAGDGTRGAYDICLSQKRADAIRDYIESKIPELVGIFVPIGNGQTTKFQGISWPTPGHTTETSKPNRRFQVKLPAFNSSRTLPAPAPVVTPPAPTPDVVSKKTKKTWNDWGVEFGDPNNPYILQVGKELNLPNHPDLEIPVGYDTNSGRVVIPSAVLKQLKSKNSINNFGYTEPVNLLSYMFNRDYKNTSLTYNIALTANSVTVSQPDMQKATPFVFKSWARATAGETKENLFIYLQTTDSKLSIIDNVEEGVVVAHVTPMIVDTALADF